MDKDEKPLSRKKKPSTKKLDVSPSMEQIRKLLKETLMENIDEHKLRSKQDIEAMVFTMEEFLRSFILVGYNLKNEPVIITHARTQLDADALYSSFNRMFFNLNNNGGI